MQKTLQFIRKYPLSILCILLIWYLSFFTPPETKLEEVPFVDKWIHLIMYGGTCTVIWIEYMRSHSVLDKARLFVWAWLAPVVMSGVIEILQENCTNHRRSGDWYDFAANTLGVTLAVVIGLLLRKHRYFNAAAGGK